MFYVLEEAVDPVLVNPAHVKGLSGRKTGVLDAVSSSFGCGGQNVSLIFAKG